jgi:hypothetical protein
MIPGLSFSARVRIERLRGFRRPAILGDPSQANRREKFFPFDGMTGQNDDQRAGPDGPGVECRLDGAAQPVVARPAG